jgi:anti-sigma-K factor RskA
MEEIELSVPEPIVDSLPEDGTDTQRDMEEAVAGWEARLDDALADDVDVSAVVTLIERFEERWEAYDEYVVELRAWGQSPIYAMAWRDLLAVTIQRIYDHGDLADRIDRERNARIVEDGIRRS